MASGYGTQVLVFAQQALYRLSSLSPQPKFCFVLFRFQGFFFPSTVSLTSLSRKLLLP